MQPLSQYFCSFSREITSWNIQHVLKSSIPTIPYFCSAAFAIRIRQALNIAPIGSSRLKINSLTMPLLFLFLENGTATHSSILAWRIPWTEEPGKLQSMGSQRVRHDWRTNTFHPESVCVCVCVCVCEICHITPQWSDFKEGYDIYLNLLAMIYPSFIISLGISYLWFSGFLSLYRKISIWRRKRSKKKKNLPFIDL